MQFNGPDADHLRKALEASGTGTWCFDVASGKIYADNIAKQLFGITAYTTTYTHLFALAHPDDREAVNNAVLTALSFGVLDVTYNTQSGKITVKGKKYTDEASGLESFHGTVRLTVLKPKSLAKVAKNEDTLNAIIQQSPIAIGLYVGREMIVALANEVMLNFWGKDASIIGERLDVAVPELEGQPFLQILDDVFTTGEIYQVSEAPAKLAVNGILDVYYFDFTYKPLFDDKGKVYAIMNMAVDVSDRMESKVLLQESEARFRTITEQSPMAIGLLKGREMVVELGNEKIFQVWGKDPSIIGLPILEALPEIRGQVFVDILNSVYDSGLAYKGYDVLAQLMHNGVLTDVYFDFIYTPLTDEDGNTSGILILANDVTQRIQTIKKIVESEERFKAVIYSAQAAMAVFKGRDLVADIANAAFLEFVGRSEKEMIGKPLLESMPEMAGQSSIELMHEVFDKGIKTHHYGRLIHIVKNGVLTPNYYNVSYTPLFDGDGNVYAVLDIAIDVTESIKAQQAIEEAEASLRSAVELANLATWSLDPTTLKLTYSDRLNEWFGLTGTDEDVQHVIDVVHINDRERIGKSLMYALQPQSGGIYDEEYTIINRINGRERILHAQGKAYFDKDDKPYLFTGTAQDITIQRKLQLSLENEVAERTKALQKANIELEEINHKLVNTNEELEQYAYVASHDLQEPLRKISMFSNLLKERDKDDTHKSTIDKIVRSSERMSLLIKDLLEFSRLLNPDTRFVRTNMQTILSAIITDFELLVEEKQAEISIDALPFIDAVPLQMNQLFYNLIGNALKFVAPNATPKIIISCEKVGQEEVKQYISQPKESEYYKISIKDNGIGIDEQYQKQIFEVFKRLHSRTEYSGSGIGLAICRRIAVNHQGAIYIKSALGQGTTFYILLPEKQVAH